MKSLRNLALIGLDTERSYAIAGQMVRIYFRLSGPPPLGWSYIFTTIWNEVIYPSKRPAGVESDRIWIDCIPEEVAAYHLERLESAVAQTNARYREGTRQQAFIASHQTELEAQLRSKLQDLSQTLYPEVEPVEHDALPGHWASAFLAKLMVVSFLKRWKRQV